MLSSVGKITDFFSLIPMIFVRWPTRPAIPKLQHLTCWETHSISITILPAGTLSRKHCNPIHVRHNDKIVIHSIDYFNFQLHVAPLSP